MGETMEMEEETTAAKRETPGGFRILNESTELVPAGSIQPHPRNVNRANLPPIAESIRVNGFYGTVIVQKSTGFILAGSHRWREAVEQGAAEVPVTFIDVDDATALRIMLADSRTQRLGADDPLPLSELLGDMGELAGTGFTEADLDALLTDAGMQTFQDAGTSTASKSSARDLGNQRNQIKPVLYADDVAVFEAAVLATKIQNRGKALIEICRVYLRIAEGQLDV
jgi:hypothetical protein